MDMLHSIGDSFGAGYKSMMGSPGTEGPGSQPNYAQQGVDPRAWSGQANQQPIQDIGAPINKPTYDEYAGIKAAQRQPTNWSNPSTANSLAFSQMPQQVDASQPQNLQGLMSQLTGMAQQQQQQGQHPWATGNNYVSGLIQQLMSGGR